MSLYPKEQDTQSNTDDHQGLVNRPRFFFFLSRRPDHHCTYDFNLEVAQCFATTVIGSTLYPVLHHQCGDKLLSVDFFGHVRGILTHGFEALRNVRTQISQEQRAGHNGEALTGDFERSCRNEVLA